VTPLEVGSVAPDFSLRDQHGQRVTLSSFRGRRSAVLVFYPWAFSSVCSSELVQLRDAWPSAAGEDTALLAVSCDPMYSLRAFGDAERLEFPLLSDFWPHGAVASAYGVFDEELGCATRSTFVVDRAGTVRWSVHNAMPDARSLEECVAAVAGLGS